MPLINIPYDRLAVIAYAEKWAMSRNPKYYNYNLLGGDCTNFASQCLFAGCKVMNYTKTYGWYYKTANDKTPSWSGVEYYYNFLTGNSEEGPAAVVCDINDLEIGDFIQLGNMEEFYHTLTIVRIDGEKTIPNIYVATHTYDSYNRSLATYNYRESRYLHINSVKKWVKK